LDDELRGRVERELSTGAALPVVCKRTGAKQQSLERWLRDGKVVRRRLECAPASVPVEELSEPELVDAIGAAAEPGSWRAAAWLLERRWPERWAKPGPRPAKPGPETPDPFADIIDISRHRRPST
jgi:hypothetical protein